MTINVCKISGPFQNYWLESHPQIAVRNEAPPHLQLEFIYVCTYMYTVLRN